MDVSVGAATFLINQLKNKQIRLCTENLPEPHRGFTNQLVRVCLNLIRLTLI